MYCGLSCIDSTCTRTPENAYFLYQRHDTQNGRWATWDSSAECERGYGWLDGELRSVQRCEVQCQPSSTQAQVGFRSLPFDARTQLRWESSV